jgi:hypothetical protein
MYKADLWRLCKLYINGGIYADIDLVPYINIDSLDKDITFYSCLAVDRKSIFQAFIVNFSKPKNPLLYVFLLSFLLNNPYKYSNGPTVDMYKCIQYNVNSENKLNEPIQTEKKYKMNEIKINIVVGTCNKNTKSINLFYFPNDVPFQIIMKSEIPEHYKFSVVINCNQMIVRRLDKNIGWRCTLSYDIVFPSKESIYLFKENMGKNDDWRTAYVTNKNKKILDSRDTVYSFE